MQPRVQPLWLPGQEQTARDQGKKEKLSWEATDVIWVS